jgi:phosphoglycolate phosphatase
MIGGVVFDKDGTLFDFRQSWGGWTRRLLQDLAVDTDHAHRLAASISFDPETGQFGDDSPVIAATGEEIAAHLLPHLPGMALAALVTRINLLAVEAEMAPAVPLDPLLTALRLRGLQLGVATNDIEAAARAHLSTAGISGHFDVILGADSGHGAKPGPGMLLAFSRATGLMPEQVLMVGDSAHDLVAGRAAGMRPVAVLTGIAREDELRPLADVVLPDIGHLPLWIDAQRQGHG